MDWTTAIAYISQKDFYISNSIITLEIIIGIFKVEMFLEDNILFTGYISVR